MTLDDIAGDECGVTRRHLVRDAEVEPARSPLGVVVDGDIDASFCQVPDPARATASTGIAPHFDRLATKRFRTGSVRI
jgi:hypothetical protein